MALRSFAAQPVRSTVLACGFGLGIGCMAGLLGVGEVILEQSRSPHMQGGGDLVIHGAEGEVANARYLLARVLGAPPLARRLVAASPTRDATLYLVESGRPALAVAARGGVPSLERALGDAETAHLAPWRDTPADRAWAAPEPEALLRAMDRFHPIPEAPALEASWAEWLYFNARSPGASFYLTFLAGPRTASGGRSAGVRLQLERGERSESYVARGEIDERELLAGAPDLSIGRSSVRLVGTAYEIDLALDREGAARGAEGRADLVGHLRLDARVGRSFPPFEVRGAGGWISGYVVPVLSGRFEGTLEVDGVPVPLEGARGYHDHNWGFWDGVTWQWGETQGEGVALLYGRIHPPAAVADPSRVPGFLVALGEDGPLGYSTAVRIDERDDPRTRRPVAIRVEGQGELALVLDFDVEREIESVDRLGTHGRFLQLSGRYTVRGRAGARAIAFTAPGSAETFRPAVPRSPS